MAKEPTPKLTPVLDENIAYLTAADGTRYQVLNAEGTDWDEAATVAAFNAGEAAKTAPAP